MLITMCIYTAQSVGKESNVEEKVREQNVPTDYRCPICGGTISANSNFFGCDNYKKGCVFKIWRIFMNVRLNDNDIADLIQKERTTRKVSGFYSQKYQHPFVCHLVYSRIRNRVEFERLTTDGQ